MFDLKKLIEAGVHFGHQTWRWCPKMKPYIWGSKNSVHLIDVSKTAIQMEKASKFLEKIASEGKTILWVGTKKSAQHAIQDIAIKLTAPFVTHRWIGGTLTNFPQVKKSVTKLLHYEDVLSKADQHLYTKKELGLFQKMVERNQKNVGGIRKLSWPIGAVVIVDVKKEHTAVREAASAGVPIVALVDTNSDPSLVDYVIPANDDIPRSVSVILGYLSEAVARGQSVAEANRPQEDVASENSVEKMLEQALRGDDEEEKNRGPRRRHGGSSGPRGGATGARRPGQQQQRGPRPSGPAAMPSKRPATENAEQAKSAKIEKTEKIAE